MLLTVQAEARRQEVIMPSPERFHKVKKSMAMIKVVLDERVSSLLNSFCSPMNPHYFPLSNDRHFYSSQGTQCVNLPMCV
jgi:hypothetical protein